MVPDKSEHVTEGGSLLTIPGGLSDRNLPIRAQRLPKEGHKAVEAEEQGSRALNRSICPLALCLNAQVSTTFLKGHFQTPALHKVADDLFCRLSGVDGKDGFRRAFARGIVSQDPTNR